MRNTLNLKSVVKETGHLLLIESAMMLLPLVVALLYGESDWKGFAVAIAASALTGGVMTLATRRVSAVMRGREGFILTAGIWVVFGVFGAIPFMLSATPLGFTDAFFETISGFTTTGASVIRDVEAQSHGILFWRALTQWIGGLGIILFMLAVLPELNKSIGLSMFNAEATGITHSKVHPRIRQTALSLWGVYVALTAVTIVLLWLGPMDLFDSVCQTFAAVATGGFSTRNASIAAWDSPYVMSVLTVVMFVAGLNFIVLYSVRKEGLRYLLRNEVSRVFCAIVLVSVALMIFSAWLRGAEPTADNYLFYPFFHVVSAITSTGFAATNVEIWGGFALLVTILLMLAGSCAGSTAGGIKVDRLIVLWRNLVNEIKKTIFPRRTYVVHLNGSYLEGRLQTRVSAFVTLYMIIVLLATGIAALFGYSFTDSLFMTVSCIGCNGLGFGATGVEGGFALLPDALKWLMTLLMLIGRLELFTFMVLLMPAFWRR